MNLRWPGVRLLGVGAAAALLMAAPAIFGSDLVITLLSQAGIAVIACLSFNLLLGQGGMLSFGHAVYSGLGAFAAIHALNAYGPGGALPLPLLPLVGGAAGLASAALLGWLATRRAGSAFAMVTLAIGELVHAAALTFGGFFGGEQGISADRTRGTALFGIGWDRVDVYALIACYTVLCAVAIAAFGRTPLGRLLNAVRDNADRVAFIGFDPRRIRWAAFVIAGFFAGVSGGLSAILLEHVSSEMLGSARSGAILLFTVIGGTSVFLGPVIGGVLMGLAPTLLGRWSDAALLYLGLIFIAVVLRAPDGIAGGLLRLRKRTGEEDARARPGRHAANTAAALLVAGSVGAIELIYRHAAAGGMGQGASEPSTGAWIVIGLLLAGGAALWCLSRRRHAAASCDGGKP